MSEQEKLEPCSFCGSEQIEFHSHGIEDRPDAGYFVCFNCDAMGPLTGNANSLTELWNTRPIESAIRADVATLTSKLAWQTDLAARALDREDVAIAEVARLRAENARLAKREIEAKRLIDEGQRIIAELNQLAVDSESYMENRTIPEADAAKAEIASLRAQVERLSVCPNCNGSGGNTASVEHHPAPLGRVNARFLIVGCRMCGGTGHNPLAKAKA